MVGPSLAVRDFLECLDVRANLNAVRRTLRRHPDRGSRLAIIESLAEWGVRAEGLRGKVEDLDSEHVPSLVELNNGRSSEYAVLEKVASDQVTIEHPVDGRQEILRSDFSQRWAGVLIRALPSSEPHDWDDDVGRREDTSRALTRAVVRYGLPGLVILSIALMALREGNGAIVAVIGSLKATGLVLCTVLVSGSFQRGGVLHRFCPLGRTMNCSRVMASPAGKLFGIPMAEAGLLYFAGGLISLCIGASEPTLSFLLSFLGVASAIGLPYTVFSIAYQAFVVRSWCWLCVAVQVLLWCEFLSLRPEIGFFAERSSVLGFGYAGFGVVSALLGWFAIRRLVGDAGRVQESEDSNQRLRRDPDYVALRLEKAPIEEFVELPSDLRLGPDRAPMKITLVLNPMCGHCGGVYRNLDDLVRIGGGQVQGVIRFLLFKKSGEASVAESSVDKEISLRVLAIAQECGMSEATEAAADWFLSSVSPKKRYREWIAKYKTTTPNSHVAGLLEQQIQWCKKSKIGVTPTLFFNERRLSTGLSLSDLRIYILRQMLDA